MKNLSRNQSRSNKKVTFRRRDLKAVDKLVNDANQYKLAKDFAVIKLQTLLDELDSFTSYINNDIEGTYEDDERIVQKLESLLKQDQKQWDLYQVQVLANQGCQDQDNGWKLPTAKQEINDLLAHLNMSLFLNA